MRRGSECITPFPIPLSFYPTLTPAGIFFLHLYAHAPLSEGCGHLFTRRPPCAETVEGIDAITEKGYLVYYGDHFVQLDYPNEDTEEKAQRTGVSFHHGRFIQKLRDAAKAHASVSCVEGMQELSPKRPTSFRNVSSVRHNICNVRVCICIYIYTYIIYHQHIYTRMYSLHMQSCYIFFRLP